LFPLIVVVLLVYLAGQTLLDDGDSDDEIPYSEAKDLVANRPGTIRLVMFLPRGKELVIELASGRKLTTHYPSDESALRFEELLETNGIVHDSRGSGDSAWWSILTYLLPFVLFFGFWLFLMDRVKGSRLDRRSADADNELQPRR
jgi:cell division protease FtsH